MEVLMPLQATSGAASYDAFGGGVAAVPQYIEDVFSTWLYTGIGAGTAQTITNGIDLSTKGGLVWIKERTSGSYNHILSDTVRGGNRYLSSNTTGAQSTDGSLITAFNTTGFSLQVDASWNGSSSQNYASWTFRKQPKFFDVVTYTGNDVTSRQISHSLGSVPGCIIVKCTSNSASWVVYHRSLSTDSGTVDSNNLILNSTGAESGGGCFGDDQYQTSTYFTLGRLGSGSNDNFNRSGRTYVAYLFAHNAGGFGLTGTDNVISCGSFTTDGSGNFSVNLGYEPQYVLVKRSSASSDWFIFDTMRGLSVTNDAWVTANTSDAESSGLNLIDPTASGFNINFGVLGYTSSTFIYIAIRRGPMKVPTTGTSVFSQSTFGSAGDSKAPAFRSTQSVDLGFYKDKSSGSDNWVWADRLRGANFLRSNTTGAEAALADLTFDYQNGWYNSTGVASNFVSWMFRRAPGFMDVCCYTGNSTSGTYYNHNLNAVPEMMIFKPRNVALDWTVYHQALGSARLTLNNTDQALGTIFPFSPTSTQIQLGGSPLVNGSTYNYVAYLFATCPGVSKVGSYTGTGTTLQINCGFTGGARFVLIKKTSGTGSWYVWDSSRGIVAGNDPYLLLNSTAAEVTNTDYVDTASVGFEISSTAPSEINENGGSFIFLAIA
jgi:hypothetical protein